MARKAPDEIKELAQELSSLQTAINVLEQEVRDPNSVLVQGGDVRKKAVQDLMSNVKDILEKLEAYAKKHGLIVDRTAQRPKFTRAPGTDEVRQGCHFHNRFAGEAQLPM